jgi:hypothetical protein
VEIDDLTHEASIRERQKRETRAACKWINTQFGSPRGEMREQGQGPWSHRPATTHLEPSRLHERRKTAIDAVSHFFDDRCSMHTYEFVAIVLETETKNIRSYCIDLEKKRGEQHISVLSASSEVLGNASKQQENHCTLPCTFEFGDSTRVRTAIASRVREFERRDSQHHHIFHVVMIWRQKERDISLYYADFKRTERTST